MIKKSTLIVVLCTVVLGTLVYYFDWKRGNQAKPAADASKPAFSIQAGDVTSLRLTHPAKPSEPEIRLEKHSDAWQILQPVTTGTDQTVVQGIVDGLAGARVSQTEPDTPDRLKSYGLDPPQVSLEFQLRNGAKHTVLLGDKDFTGSSVYAIVDGAKTVSLLPESILTSSTKSVDDLRDRAVLHITSGQVASFTLKASSGELAAAKENNEWKLSKPRSAPADSDVVDSLLSTVANARMSAVASEKPDALGKFGLAPPAVIFTTIDDKGKKSTLLVGKKEGNEYFARDPSRPMIFRVSDDVHKQLAKSYSDLRDKKVLHLNSDDINRIEIHNDHGTITASRKDYAWRIESPDAQKGKTATSSKMLDPLTALRAGEVVDQPPANLLAQLAKAPIEATLTDKGGKKITVRVSKPSGDVVYAQTSESSALYKLKKQDFDSLNFEAGQVLE
jgi:hypothetical protein